MSECIFCKIIAGEIPALKLHETEQVLVLLDIGPVSPGHTLFIPKRHAENLGENTLAEANDLMTAIHTLAPKIVAAVGADGYNLGMNHGAVAGQDVFHTHVHLMPRKQGEAVKFVKNWPPKEELAEIAAAITKKLAN